MRSLREQGVALADGVARVHLHGFGYRLEAGVLDPNRVATGLDRVLDQWRLTGIHAVDVDLAERVGCDGQEPLRLGHGRLFPRLCRCWPTGHRATGMGLYRYTNRVLNSYRVDGGYRSPLPAPLAP